MKYNESWSVILYHWEIDNNNYIGIEEHLFDSEDVAMAFIIYNRITEGNSKCTYFLKCGDRLHLPPIHHGV